MKKIVLFLLVLIAITGCLPQNVNTHWEDSNLDKKEYFRRKNERLESEKANVGAWDKILDSSWDSVY